MLDECLAHLKSKSDSDPEFTFEVIVVSDGSKDNTVKVATEYSNKYGTDVFRVLELERNRGKGGAVRLVRVYIDKCDETCETMLIYYCRVCRVQEER